MTKTATLTPAQEKFILHWGEMGERWGVNRTVAQIHALLFLSERPLNAEEISTTLSVARSNVSVSLRELLSWKLVRAVNTLGDRTEHFETHKDVWEMFKVILDGRKQREIDPTLSVLNECVAEAKDKHTAERLAAMREFFEASSSWYESIRPMPAGVAKRLMKLGGKVSKILACGLLFLCAGTASSQPQKTQSSDQGFVDSLKNSDEFKKLVKIGVAQYFQAHTVSVRGQWSVVRGGKELRMTVPLKPLRNKQWGVAAFFPMGGIRTALSGQFSRKRNAYFAVMPDGAAAPAFVSINDLIDGDAGVLVNNVEYRLTLNPNLFDRLASKIVVRKAADGTETGVTMRRILDKVYEGGAAVDLGEKHFRMFCGQDAEEKGDVTVAGDKESVVFMLPVNGEYDTFLIPQELIPTDGTVGVFPLRGDLKLLLRLNDGILEVY